MRRKISQRQAREYKREFETLLYKLRHGGQFIDQLEVTNTEAMIVRTAHKLDHITVVRNGDGNQLRVFALRLL